jgi:hypothetical protein
MNRHHFIVATNNNTKSQRNKPRRLHRYYSLARNTQHHFGIESTSKSCLDATSLALSNKFTCTVESSVASQFNSLLSWPSNFQTGGGCVSRFRGYVTNVPTYALCLSVFLSWAITVRKIATCMTRMHRRNCVVCLPENDSSGEHAAFHARSAVGAWSMIRIKGGHEMWGPATLAALGVKLTPWFAFERC